MDALAFFDALHAGPSWAPWRAFVAAVYGEPLDADPTDSTLAPLPRHCGCSESFLSRTFRQEVGTNFARYRNSVRLGRFWEYYRSGQCETLVEAVFAAGFGSYAQFFRVFTAAYGTSPRRALANT